MRNPRLRLLKDRVRKIYGFRLIGYLKSYDFYCTTKDARNEWVKRLRRVCVSNDILNHYKFGGLLGKGSFSHVYKAVNLESKEEYAIKRIDKKHVSKNLVSLLSLEEEIKIMRMLDHPNIIKLYEVYEDEQYIYMIEEYLRGGELLKEIKERGVYSEKETAILMKKLLETLAYCHEKNVIHLDLKLENLILM